MISSYPEKAALKEVLSTSLPITTLKYFCKNNGILLLSSDKELMIRDAHLFYWGYDDINEISNCMEDEKNYKKSFRLKLDYESDDSSIDAFTDLYGVMTNYRNTISASERISFESLNIVTMEGQPVLCGEVSYIRRKPGKVELLSEVVQKFTFQAKKPTDYSINIDFIFSDRNDVTIAKRLVNTAIAASNALKAPVQISLKPLKIAERVELFDQFFAYSFNDWRIVSIQDIKISDGQVELEDDEDNEALKQSILSGIKSAHLSGTGLRSNPIVVQAVKLGYFFPKATILFEHKREAQQISVDVSFATEDLLLEIIMVTTYEVADDRPYKHPMMVNDQRIILEEFHDVMQLLHSKIIDARNIEA